MCTWVCACRGLRVALSTNCIAAVAICMEFICCGCNKLVFATVTAVAAAAATAAAATTTTTTTAAMHSVFMSAQHRTNPADEHDGCLGFWVILWCMRLNCTFAAPIDKYAQNQQSGNCSQYNYQPNQTNLLRNTTNSLFHSQTQKVYNVLYNWHRR